jgi:dihydropteroate synthase
MIARLDTPAGSLTFGDVTHVMGVINLSPESKNVHTIALSASEALDMARTYRRHGATIIDLGAQSSHLDNPTIEADIEIERLLPALSLLADDGFLVSVDTWKPEVAQAALSAGAAIVNDTGGLADPGMRSVVRRHQAAAILMYVEGANPHDVGEITIAADKASITAAWMERRLAELTAEGIGRLIADPGIAINYRGDYQAYTRMQLDVIRNIDRFRSLGLPVMVPIPRKREDHRVVAYITMALEYGADIIRAHDVEWACDLVHLFGRAPV